MPKQTKRPRGGQADQLRLTSVQKPEETDASLGTLRVSGLFAGIGGIELGLARAGHETDLLCEFDPAASAVLHERFPAVRKHSDVRTLRSLPKSTGLVTAGFPCQDLSQAGKTAGIEGARSGLVGEVFRLLEKRRVPWVLLENVSFMLRLAGGRALEVVISALEALGYRWAYRVVDSRAFGLPQRRQRVFLLASLSDDPRTVLLADDAGEASQTSQGKRVACGFYWTEGVRGLGWAVNAVPTLKGGSTVGIPSPPAIWMPDGSIVTPDIRDAERMQGFEADWTAPAERVTRKGGRWKLVGNAVSVDAAEWIGARLARPGRYDGTFDAPMAKAAKWPTAAWNVGSGRFASEVSMWPVRRKAPPLASFLRFPVTDLSVRAAAGFLKRAHSGNLRFPEGFLEAVEAHRERMQTAAAA